MCKFMVHEIIIPGDPVPQKQTRFARGRAYDPSSKDKERIRKYLWAARPEQPLDGPVDAVFKFFFEIPKSYTRAQRMGIAKSGYMHTKKPDADNCAYLITNALKGLWIVDDSQIVNLFIIKRYTLESARTIVRLCLA